jgi:hypothetical protein
MLSVPSAAQSAAAASGGPAQTKIVNAATSAKASRPTRSAAGADLPANGRVIIGLSSRCHRTSRKPGSDEAMGRCTAAICLAVRGSVDTEFS